MKKILLILLIISIHLSSMTAMPQAAPAASLSAVPGAHCSARLIPHTENAASAESAYTALDGILSLFMDEVVGSLIDEFAPGELNEKEKELVKAHPLAAVQVAWARDTANAVTEGLFGESWKTENTRENAFRHCLWNALMAYTIGPELARQFGDAHEYGMMEKYPENTKMDLHNNEIGYQIGTAPFTEDELGAEARARYGRAYGRIFTSYDPHVYVIIDRACLAMESGLLYWFAD